MSELLAAALGALAVIGIPLVAWYSRRATREGRLLLRIQKFGSAYELMPESSEKETFRVHLTGAIADLNSWMDADNASRRKLIRRINGWTYGVGVAALLLSLPIVESPSQPWLASVLGTTIGFAIAIATMSASFVVERSARQKSAETARQRDEALAEARVAAFQQGTPFSSTTLGTE